MRKNWYWFTQKHFMRLVPLEWSIVVVILLIIVAIVAPWLTEPKFEREEDKTYSLYEITEMGFNGFLITAFYDDPNQGYAYHLNQAVDELELKGYEIKTIVPRYYQPTSNQLQSIWVRVERKEGAKAN